MNKCRSGKKPCGNQENRNVIVLSKLKEEWLYIRSHQESHFRTFTVWTESEKDFIEIKKEWKLTMKSNHVLRSNV